MTALAWPLVVLVLGVLAFRAFSVWMRERRAEVQSLLNTHRSEVGALRQRVASVEACWEQHSGQAKRLQALEDWRLALRNRNGGRD